MRFHFITALALAGVLIPGAFVLASSPFDIEFPIPELDSCADKEACKQYCDDLSHKDACVAFGERHGLISSDEAERVTQLPPTGPGGCRGEAECRAYCEDILHVEECVAFGEAHNLIDEKEAAQARGLVGQTGPGGCRGANECRAYCDDAAHGEECLEFANRKGLINARELEVSRSLRVEGGPGGCRTPDTCRAYCQDPAHLSECADSAVAHGLLGTEEAVRIKKQHIAEGPGGCNGPGECRAYCADSAHQEECISFGEKNGLMSSEEVRRARILFGKPGPGGCRGEACRAYCETSEHVDECTAFAEQSGVLPAAELERAKKFQKISLEGGPGGCKGQECKTYCEDPARQSECFDFAKEKGLIRPEEARQFETTQKLQSTIARSGGPGGCKGPEECRAYCTDAARAEECVAFGVAHGGLPEAEVREKLKEFSERRLEAEGEFRPAKDFRRMGAQTQRRFEEFKLLEREFRGKGPAEEPGGFGQLPAIGIRVPDGQAQGAPSGTIGPGGCASPAECIRYCAEHKGECFGPSGGRPDEGNASPAVGGSLEGDTPQLRRDLIHAVKPGEFPENFEKLPPGERRELFRQKFETPRPPEGSSEGSEGERGTLPGRPGEFPGRPPQQFPGRTGSGEPAPFPGRPNEFPARSPEAFPGRAPFGEKREPARPETGAPSFEGVKPLPGILHPFPSESPLKIEPFRAPEGNTSGSFPPPTDGTFSQPSPPKEPFAPAPTFAPPPVFSPPPPPAFVAPPPPTGGFTPPAGGTFTPPPSF